MPQVKSDIRVSGKNIDIGAALRSQARERVQAAVEKYFRGGFDSRVTVEKEGTGFRTDCTVHLDSGAVMHVSGMAHDAYASVDQVVERIAKQLRRDKRKRTARSGDATVPIAEISDRHINGVAYGTLGDDSGQDNGGSRPIVAETVRTLDTVYLDEAIRRMETSKISSYVFKNRGTDRINILHDRPDGTVGWIDLAP
jgi:ribosomal subunit interface protein